MDANEIVIGMRVIVTRPQGPSQDVRRPMWHGQLEITHGKTFTVKSRRFVTFPASKNKSIVLEILVKENDWIFDPEWLSPAPALTQSTTGLLLPSTLPTNKMQTINEKQATTDDIEFYDHETKKSSTWFQLRKDVTSSSSSLRECRDCQCIFILPSGPYCHTCSKNNTSLENALLENAFSEKYQTLEIENLHFSHKEKNKKQTVENKILQITILELKGDYAKIKNPYSKNIVWMHIKERSVLGKLLRIELAAKKSRDAGFSEDQIQKAIIRAKTRHNIQDIMIQEKLGFTLVRPHNKTTTTKSWEYH